VPLIPANQRCVILLCSVASHTVMFLCYSHFCRRLCCDYFLGLWLSQRQVWIWRRSAEWWSPFDNDEPWSSDSVGIPHSCLRTWQGQSVGVCTISYELLYWNNSNAAVILKCFAWLENGNAKCGKLGTSWFSGKCKMENVGELEMWIESRAAQRII